MEVGSAFVGREVGPTEGVKDGVNVSPNLVGRLVMGESVGDIVEQKFGQQSRNLAKEQWPGNSWAALKLSLSQIG